MKETSSGLRRYQVEVRRLDEAHALASSHGFTLSLGVRRGDPSAGFNAAETLLAALGACITTNINALAAKMRLRVDEVRVDLVGYRRDNPPGIVRIDYTLTLVSPEPEDKLRRLDNLAFKYGTVTNTLPERLELHRSLRIERPAVEEREG
ncbi:MAG TPA: OsmC family peroxiredoxin [Chromatiales bacterium]|nr:OsmC family peroxiredoxin [Chromatiales bacterium]